MFMIFDTRNKKKMSFDIWRTYLCFSTLKTRFLNDFRYSKQDFWDFRHSKQDLWWFSILKTRCLMSFDVIIHILFIMTWNVELGSSAPYPKLHKAYSRPYTRLSRLWGGGQGTTSQGGGTWPGGPPTQGPAQAHAALYTQGPCTRVAPVLFQ